MDWGFWIVPVIVIAVWILRTVLGQARQQQPPGPVAGGARPRPVRREPVTDLESFLRRLQEGKEEAEAPERRPPPRAERPTRPRPPLPGATRPRPAQPRAPRAEPVPVVEEALPVVLAVEEVPVARPVAPVVKPAPGTVPVAIPVDPGLVLTERLPPVPTSRALQDLMKVLRTAEGMRQAILLKEILGPPVARRPR